MEYREDGLTERIIGCVIKVHQVLGPGFLENVYRRALLRELREQKWRAETERAFVVYYEGEEVGRHRVDLLVEKRVILELKPVEELGVAHYAQIRSTLHAAGLTTGLLVNFCKEKAEFRRIEFP